MAEHLNNISSGPDLAIQEQAESERSKMSLIVNASRDIKTPLTSIVNYVGPLKREKIQGPKTTVYLKALDQKSQRLKTPAEDLVEASKASSGSVKLNTSDIDPVELVRQINDEFEGQFALCGLGLISGVPDEVLIIQADGHRLRHVLENLYTNAVKYAMEYSRVYMDVLDKGGKAIFITKNASESSLNISLDEPTERFIRGGASRVTEGSGLGLSISKDLTRPQGGEFQVVIDGGLFETVVSLPVKRVGFRAEKTVGEPGDMSQDFGYGGDIVV